MEEWEVLYMFNIITALVTPLLYTNLSPLCLQEAVFNKARNTIELQTFSLYALVLTVTRRGHDQGILVIILPSM